MPSKTVIVGSSIGLHARPAAIIAEAVVEAGVPVTLSVDGGEPVAAEHTQPATGEALNVGWEYTETVSGTHNLIADAALGRSSSHLWRIALPSDLEPGEHTLTMQFANGKHESFGPDWATTITVTVADGGSAAAAQ